MKTEFKKSFLKDVKALRDAGLKERIRDAINLVERAETLQGLSGIKKLAGSDRYYRIRIGDYRMGLIIEGNTVTFVRCLHRREIYRYIP